MGINTWTNYGNAKQYQAEIFKLGGCALCTPICAYVLTGILNPKPLLLQIVHGFNIHFVACLVLAWLGLRSINVGYIIMEGLDKERDL